MFRGVGAGQDNCQMGLGYGGGMSEQEARFELSQPIHGREVYVLRLWYSPNAVRGEIERVTTGERVGIESAEALVEFMAQLWTERPRPKSGLR